MSRGAFRHARQVTPKRIDVVGAVIERGGAILCARRGSGSKLAGMWEFPGGKVEPGETACKALVREIDEELGCEISVGDEVTTTSHVYEFGTVTLTTFWCRLAAGEPRPIEHSELRWLAPADLDQLGWSPADLPTVATILAARVAD